MPTFHVLLRLHRVVLLVRSSGIPLLAWSDLTTSVLLLSSLLMMYLSLSTVSFTDLSAAVNVQFVCLHTTTFTILFPPLVLTRCGPVLSQHRCDPKPVGFLCALCLWDDLLGLPSPHDSHFCKSFTSCGCRPISGTVDSI